MTDHVAIASLICDIAGAVLLARALALESPEQWIASVGTPTYAVDGGRDAARARDAAEARYGLVLLAAGFAGQAVDAAIDGTTCIAAFVSYPTCALLVVGALVLVRPATRRQMRRIVRARLRHGTRYPPAELLTAYSNSLANTRYARRDDEKLRQWAERAFGRDVLDGVPGTEHITD